MGSRITLLLCILVVGLTSCAKRLYVKEGATPEQFEADRFDCEHKVVTMYGGYAQMGLGHAILARDDMDRCLRSKGYTEQLKR